jgi:hypothetical protein
MNSYCALEYDLIEEKRLMYKKGTPASPCRNRFSSVDKIVSSTGDLFIGKSPDRRERSNKETFKGNRCGNSVYEKMNGSNGHSSDSQIKEAKNKFWNHLAENSAIKQNDSIHHAKKDEKFNENNLTVVFPQLRIQCGRADIVFIRGRTLEFDDPKNCYGQAFVNLPFHHKKKKIDIANQVVTGNLVHSQIINKAA